MLQPTVLRLRLRTFRLHRSLLTGNDIPIAEHSADEVAGYGKLLWAPQGTRIANPIFDVTPAELVTALFTEAGVVQAEQAAIAGLFAG